MSFQKSANAKEDLSFDQPNAILGSSYSAIHRFTKVVALALVVSTWPFLLGHSAAVQHSSDTAAGAVTAPKISPDAIFGTPRLTLGGAWPRAVAATDFDNDGSSDLAVATFETLRIMLGTGNGTFHPGLMSNLHFPISELGTGDFNGDGRPDLMVKMDADVAVLLGNGKGSFQEPMPLHVGCTSGCAAGDFNGDGKLDLAVAQFYAKRLLIMLGRGDGTFQTGPQSYSAAQLSLILASDIDGDGRLDISLIDRGSLSVLFGIGDATFRAPVTSRIGAGEGALTVCAAGDFNQDRKSDLAVGEAGNVSILLSVGDGTFHDAGQKGPLGTVLFIEAGDFNRDGLLDLALTTSTPEVIILMGVGDGTFGGSAAYDAGPGAGCLTVGDFNNDAKPDLAVANGSSVSMLLGKGDGTFFGGSYYEAGPDPDAVAAGDFDGDGNPDVAVANRYGRSGSTNGLTFVLLGKSDGTFQPAIESRTGPVPVAIAAADLNADGKLDLITANLVGEIIPGFLLVPPGTISVLLGRGNGTFHEPVDYSAGTQPVCVAVGDFNVDDKLDVAIGNAGTPMSNWVDGSATVLLGRGDGSFQPPVSYPAGERLDSLAVADFNSDAKPDLVTGSFSGATLLLGNGDGSFRPSQQLTALTGPVTIADLNQDDKPDVAVVSLGVHAFLGQGDGTFKPGINLGPTDFRGCAALADLNADGEQDLVLVGAGVGVMLGKGEAEFEPALFFDVQATHSFALADFNHDGKPDLAVVNRRHLTVLLNTAAPPQLELILRLDGGILNLSWSALFPGAILEAASTLAPDHWERIPEVPVQHRGHWKTSVLAPRENRFFRLRHP